MSGTHPPQAGADRAGDVGAGDDDVLDVLGIGFGPSNLALAIAAAELAAADPRRALRVGFLERQPRFGWHRGMLIDDATMQISFLKDLVTQRNPASDFSFVSYLHECGRLADFINHKTLFPLRIEFHAYLEWAAARVGHLVTYGRTVVDVQPVADGDVVVAWDVVSRAASGEVTVQRARDLAIATGLQPRLPAGVTTGPRVWHNLDILRRVETVPAAADPERFVVVGAGQSAAEVVDFLHRSYPTAEVCSVFSKWGYTPADDTPYANRIFDADAVDVYFAADEGVKRMLFDAHRSTNYSVVDTDLINELYRREYQERVQGRPRLRMMNASEVVSADARDDGVTVEVAHLPTGERTRVRADAVVYATGYTSTDPGAVLGGAGALLARRPDGAPEVCRDYRLVLDAPADAAVYVQGGTERSHGLTSTLLSNIAVRTGEIIESILARRAAPRRAPARPVSDRLRPMTHDPTDQTRATMSTATTPRRRVLSVVAVLVLALVAACGSGGDDPATEGEGGEASDAGGSPEGDGNGFPVDVEHKYGTTTIDAAPERIVTVGLTDQDTALALGTVPVGITQWFDTHQHGVGPWAEDLLEGETPEVLDGDAVNAERIAALQPDLILAVYSALTEQEYDTLSQIAPTVAQPGEFVDYGVPWQDQTRIIGRALGQADEADALVVDVEDRFAAERADHPEFDGATGVVATPYQGTVSVYSPQDPRGRFLTDLGFVLPADLEELAGDHFAAELSTENVDLLDVDALVWILNDVQADLDRLHAEGVYGGLAVVSEGREVGVSNFEPLGEATSFQTVLSLPMLLDGLVPMLAAAVDGDPTTLVLEAGG